MGYKELSIAVIESAFTDLMPDSKIAIIENSIEQFGDKNLLCDNDKKKLHRLRKIVSNNYDARLFFERKNFLTWIGLTDFNEDFIIDRYKEIINKWI